jgi:hypothetical protein
MTIFLILWNVYFSQIVVCICICIWQKVPFPGHVLEYLKLTFFPYLCWYLWKQKKSVKK